MGLIDLREKMGEPGHPTGINRLPEPAQRNIARLRQSKRGQEGARPDDRTGSRSPSW